MPDEGIGETGGGGVVIGGGGAGAGGAAPAGGGVVAPLLTEDLQWRRRAIAAEDRLAELEKQLDEARRSVGRAELRSRIEREAQAMDAVDIETVTLLTQAALAGMDAPDVGAAMRDLKRRKAFLFRGAAHPSAMAPQGAGGEDAALARALEEARASGDRRALLEYLRKRRNA